MIRTTIIPVTTKVYLSIPKDYIGKKVEVLLYALEELSTRDSAKKKQTKERPFGVLSGKIWMADDFDAPLDDFKDYM